MIFNPDQNTILLNCLPIAGVLAPQLGLEAVLAVQHGGLVVAPVDVHLRKSIIVA